MSDYYSQPNQQPSWFDDPKNREKFEEFLASAVAFAGVLGTVTVVSAILSKILR